MAKILVVDDSKLMRFQMKQLLENVSHIVYETDDDVETIDLYRRHQPDLVTMDINMPNKSGIELVKEIIAINPKAKIIMVSSESEKDTVLDAMKAGAQD